jgi:hypothetical protein
MEYQALIKEIENVSSNDDNQVFSNLINKCEKVIVNFNKEIRTRFGIDKPSLERWKQGKNIPLLPIKKVVYNWMLEKLKE